MYICQLSRFTSSRNSGNCGQGKEGREKKRERVGMEKGKKDN
jgi:hypothetical protein